MNDHAAFVERALLRTLAERPNDLAGAFSRLRSELPQPLQSSLASLQARIERGSDLTGDPHEDALRLGLRTLQLIDQNGGALSPALCMDIERQCRQLRSLARVSLQKLRDSMLFSSATGAVAVVVGAIYTLFVIPQFQSLFASVDAAMPQFTRAVMTGGRPFLLLVALALLALAPLAFPVTRRWSRTHGEHGWRVDALAARSLVGRKLAREYRELVYVLLAASLMRAGIAASSALSLAGQAAKVHGDSAPGEADGRISAAVLAADRLGHGPAEMDSQCELQLERFSLALQRFHSGFINVIRAAVYVLVGVLVVAMYLPIFKMGAAI